MKLNSITTIQQYKELINDFKSNSENKNNLPFDKGLINHYIDDDIFYYVKKDEGLYFLVDQKKYYILFYMVKKDAQAFSLKAIDKDIMISILYVTKDIDSVLENDRLLFENSDFELESINYQIVIDLEKKRDEIEADFEKCKSTLQNNNLSIHEKDIHGDKEAISLWFENLKSTDVPYDHCNNGTIVYINDGEKMIAVAWYDNYGVISEWRHVVVDKEYRGMKLGKVMNYYWMKKAIDSGMKKGVGWVEKNNTISLSLHEKIGFMKNNKISVQYVMKKK